MVGPQSGGFFVLLARPGGATVDPRPQRFDFGPLQSLARGPHDHVLVQPRHIFDQQALGAFARHDSRHTGAAAFKGIGAPVETQPVHLELRSVAAPAARFENRLHFTDEIRLLCASARDEQGVDQHPTSDIRHPMRHGVILSRRFTWTIIDGIRRYSCSMARRWAAPRASFRATWRLSMVNTG